MGLRPFRFLVEDLLGFDEIVATPLYLGNISKDFSVNDIKKKELNGIIKLNVIAGDSMLDIHKHLIEKMAI